MTPFVKFNFKHVNIYFPNKKIYLHLSEINAPYTHNQQSSIVLTNVIIV
jgi:hypothetical protein